MSIVLKYDGALLPYQSVRLTGGTPGGIAGLPSTAWYGEPGIAGIEIDDPSGTLDFAGWHDFTVDESACSKPRIFTGWVVGRSISRGPYRTGAGRVWNCDIVDQNALFSFKTFRASSAKRPAETDIARAAWAVDSAPMAVNPAYAGAYANFTDNPANFGDSNYVTQYPLNLFESIAGSSGKVFYAFWNDSTARIELYYDLLTATNRTSTLRISNVLSDQDSVTYAPFIDATLEQDPTGIYTGFLLQYRGGLVYGSQTIAGMDVERDLFYSSDRIGYASTANAIVTSTLASHTGDKDTIRCMVQLAAADVNLINAGERVSVKFSHLPDYTSFTYVRVIRRTVIPTPFQDDLYDVHLELSNANIEQGPGGGGVVILPARPCGATTGDYVQSVDGEPGGGPPKFLTLPAAPTVGNTLIGFGQVRNAGLSPTVPTGWTDAGEGVVSAFETKGRAFYRVVQSGDTATVSWPAAAGSDQPPELAYIAEHTGILNIESASLTSTDPYNTNSPFPGAAITPTSGLPGAIVGYMFMKRNHGALSADTGWTLRDAQTVGAVVTHGVIEKDVSSTTGTYTPSFTGANPAVFDNHSYGAITLALLCSGSSDPPPTGQWVYGETPTPAPGGGRVTFSTAWPFADGSLQVFVDQVDQTAAIASFDGAAGTFTLAFDPRADEEITVNYQGR